MNPECVLFKCGKCGKQHKFESDAISCCVKKKKDWESVTRFEILPIHLKLLKNMYVSWDDCEFGSPAIDCKQPYGNSDVYGDIAEIIGLKKKDNWDFEEETWSEKAMDMMEDLHRQMQVVLQIILATGKIETGTFERSEYGIDWKGVKE